MKEISISIPEMGKKAGTLAWVAEQLSKAEFKISNNKHDIPCIWYKLENQKKWHIAVKPSVPSGDDNLFYHEYGEFFIEHPQDPNSNIWGMFKYLTDAAEEYVLDFLKKLADLFEEKLTEERIKCNVKIFID